MQTVVLQTFDNYFNANIILTRLQSEGIHCYLKDEYSVTIDPVLCNAIGGIKLAVAINDIDKAGVLLREYHDDYMRSAACPSCGLHAIIRVSAKAPRNILTALLIRIGSSYAASSENIYHCSGCGYESKTLPESAESIN